MRNVEAALCHEVEACLLLQEINCLKNQQQLRLYEKQLIKVLQRAALLPAVCCSVYPA